MRKGRSSQQTNPGRRSMLAGKTEATTHLVIRAIVEHKELRSFPLAVAKSIITASLATFPETYRPDQYVEDLPPAIRSAPTSFGRNPADARLSQCSRSCHQPRYGRC